jgi:hypothetical protein
VRHTQTARPAKSAPIPSRLRSQPARPAPQHRVPAVSVKAGLRILAQSRKWFFRLSSCFLHKSRFYREMNGLRDGSASFMPAMRNFISRTDTRARAARDLSTGEVWERGFLSVVTCRQGRQSPSSASRLARNKSSLRFEQ